MLPKPTVPPGPVIMKDTVVVAVGWYDAIVAWNICELVMFPLSARSTVAPVSVVAGTVVADGVGVGDDVGVGVGDVRVGVLAGVGVGVDVGAGVGVAVGIGDGVGVGANVAKMVFAA